MAENEYLDSTRSRRWQRVAEALRDGCNIEEIALRTQKCFYKTLVEMKKNLPLSEFVAALGDPNKLSDLCNQIEGADVTRDFLIRSAELETEPVDAMYRFLQDALGNLLYDIPHLAAELDSTVNVSAARGSLDAVRSELAADLKRVARKFVECPEWKPRRPPSRPGRETSPEEQTGRMLSESVIAGFRQ